VGERSRNSSRSTPGLSAGSENSHPVDLGDRPFREYALGEYLDAVAARQPAPSGGGVAAVTVASAAALVAMVARYSAAQPGPGASPGSAAQPGSGAQPGSAAQPGSGAPPGSVTQPGSAGRSGSGGLLGAAELAAEADALRIRVLAEADADAAAYAEVLAAYRLPRDDPARADRIRAALAGAAEVPVRIAAAGAWVATSGARAALGGNPNLVGDAMTAVLLAEAATHAATELVRINTRLGELDASPLATARAHRATAAAACRALTTDGESD